MGFYLFRHAHVPYHIHTNNSHTLSSIWCAQQVADIEEKLDILIKAYMQDRERFLALPLVPESTSHSINDKNPPNPPPPPCGGILSSSGGPMVMSHNIKMNIYINTNILLLFFVAWKCKFFVLFSQNQF